MLDARSADYIPSKATLGHSQGHSILCPIQLYTIPYTTLYNSIQPRLMSLIRPPPPTSPSSPDRFLFLHFNARLLWQAGRPFMWSWYFIILARQTLWFNYFKYRDSDRNIFLIPWATLKTPKQKNICTGTKEVYCLAAFNADSGSKSRVWLLMILAHEAGICSGTFRPHCLTPDPMYCIDPIFFWSSQPSPALSSSLDSQWLGTTRSIVEMSTGST